ncbi:MAG: hypothetical protein PVF15_09410 [Candidatus Bathyarchaeota archaeon]
MSETPTVEQNRLRLDEAKGYSEIWELVKNTVKNALGEHRVGIMLFLDDLPMRLGAYHPVGTNNIVLNRALVQAVEAATKSQLLVNAFVYILLLHEYLHALGYVREAEARRLVYRVSQRSFGEEHIVSRLARSSPWALLKGVPLSLIEGPKRVMEIVKDFEQSNQKYIV